MEPTLVMVGIPLLLSAGPVVASNSSSDSVSTILAKFGMYAVVPGAVLLVVLISIGVAMIAHGKCCCQKGKDKTDVEKGEKKKPANKTNTKNVKTEEKKKPANKKKDNASKKEEKNKPVKKTNKVDAKVDDKKAKTKDNKADVKMVKAAKEGNASPSKTVTDAKKAALKKTTALSAFHGLKSTKPAAGGGLASVW